MNPARLQWSESQRLKAASADDAFYMLNLKGYLVYNYHLALLNRSPNAKQKLFCLNTCFTLTNNSWEMGTLWLAEAASSRPIRGRRCCARRHCASIKWHRRRMKSETVTGTEGSRHPAGECPDACRRRTLRGAAEPPARALCSSWTRSGETAFWGGGTPDLRRGWEDDSDFWMLQEKSSVDVERCKAEWLSSTASLEVLCYHKYRSIKHRVPPTSV